ncbi:MAG: PP2C family protein-serine/threonine phosphatase [Candidatus Margulisiibacteriota bacterium]
MLLALLSILMLIALVVIFRLDSPRRRPDRLLGQRAIQVPIASSGSTEDLEMARRLQRGILSSALPSVPEVDIASRYAMANEIGGDFFEFLSHHNRGLPGVSDIPGVIRYEQNHENTLGIVVGDVAGHGLSSALVMALTAGLCHEIAKKEPMPGAFFTALNTELQRYIEGSHVRYVTAVYGVIYLHSKQLVYSRAGHPGILWYKPKTKQVQWLEVEGAFLGMYDAEHYPEQTVMLESGDRLFFLTDGLLEARNAGGEQFGAMRLEEAVGQTVNLPIQAAVDAVFDAMLAFCNGSVADDCTLIGIALK